MANPEDVIVEIDNLATPESDNLLSNILVNNHENKKDEKEKDLESRSR